MSPNEPSRPAASARAAAFQSCASDGFSRFLVRVADGGRPRTYPVASSEPPRAWRWESHLGSGFAALGRSAEEAERLLRDAMACTTVHRATAVA